MKGRSKFIVTVVTVIIVAVIAIICGGQRALVTASSTANVPGPSQFYLQHDLISDGFVPADITHSNLVNAWAWFQVRQHRGGLRTTEPAQPDIKFEDEKARLDNFAIQLMNDPHSSGLILMVAGQKRSKGKQSIDLIGPGRI